MLSTILIVSRLVKDILINKRLLKNICSVDHIKTFFDAYIFISLRKSGEAWGGCKESILRKQI